MDLSWVQNPLFTLSGWLIGAAGLIAAFYYGIKGKSKKELSYMIVQSEELITCGKKRVPKLHLLFENREIYDITVTCVDGITSAGGNYKSAQRAHL